MVRSLTYIVGSRWRSLLYHVAPGFSEVGFSSSSPHAHVIGRTGELCAAQLTQRSEFSAVLARVLPEETAK